MVTLAHAVPTRVARVPAPRAPARPGSRSSVKRFATAGDTKKDTAGMAGTAGTDARPLRLVAVDMDGTLLRPDSTISDDTVSVLRRVHASGATVCVASGRPAATIRRYASQLGLGPIPAVCFNGACAMLLDGDDPANDIVWHVEHLSRDVVAQVLDVAAALDLPVQYCLPDKSVTAPVNAKQSGLMDQFDALVGPEGHSERVPSLRPEAGSHAWPFPPPLKLIIITGSQSAADEVAAKARET